MTRKSFLQQLLDGIANQIGVVVVLFIVSCLGVGYGVIKKLDTIEYKVDSLREMEQTKANKQALNHMADWMKHKEYDTLNMHNESRVDVYYELVHQPPETVRGVQTSFDYRHKAIYIHPMGLYTNDER